MENTYFRRIVHLIENYIAGDREYPREELYDTIYLYHSGKKISDEEYGALLDMMEGLL